MYVFLLILHLTNGEIVNLPVSASEKSCQYAFNQVIQIDEAFMMDSGLSAFWNPPVHTLGTELASVSLLISTSVLLSVTALMIFIGQSVFSRRELM